MNNLINQRWKCNLAYEPSKSINQYVINDTVKYAESTGTTLDEVKLCQ